MSLLPPADDQSALEDCILWMNRHAASEGYAVVLYSTKKSKLGVRRKAWIICDRGRESNRPRGQERRHNASRRQNCPFSCHATFVDGIA